MELQHSFQVPVGVEEAWEVLLDVERIAPCMPGATIEAVDGDDFTATVKVKLGPMGMTYKSKASFVEKDAANHRVIIEARARDTRGNGTANAKVTAVLTGDDTNTSVSVTTDLDVTGKPAQFGRGMLSEVGEKLIGQFADSLALTLQPAQQVATAPHDFTARATGTQYVDRPSADVIDLGSFAPIALQRAAPIAAIAGLIIALLWIVRRSAS